MTETTGIDRRKTAPKPSPELAVLLAKWRTSQIRQDRSERTISERAAIVTRYEAASGERPRRFTTAGMEEWTARAGLSIGTRWTYTQGLRAYHAWLVRQDLRKDNPTSKMEELNQPKSEPRPIQPYQLAAVLRNAQGPARMMVLLAVFAGLRVHEIAKVVGQDFDPIAGELRVEGKGKKKTVVSLHEVIRAEAEHYPLRGPWFPRSRESLIPVTRQHVSKVISEAMQAAHLNATAHALRHTFATNLVNEDIDMLTIQKLMRHSSPTSTVIYAEVNQSRRADAVARLKVPE